MTQDTQHKNRNAFSFVERNKMRIWDESNYKTRTWDEIMRESDNMRMWDENTTWEYERECEMRIKVRMHDEKMWGENTRKVTRRRELVAMTPRDVRRVWLMSTWMRSHQRFEYIHLNGRSIWINNLCSKSLRGQEPDNGWPFCLTAC